MDPVQPSEDAAVDHILVPLHHDDAPDSDDIIDDDIVYFDVGAEAVTFDSGDPAPDLEYDPHIYVDPPEDEPAPTGGVPKPPATNADEYCSVQRRSIRGVVILWAGLTLAAALQLFHVYDPLFEVASTTMAALGLLMTVMALLRMSRLKAAGLGELLDVVDAAESRLSAGVREFAVVFVGCGVAVSIGMETPLPAAVSVVLAGVLLAVNAAGARRARAAAASRRALKRIRDTSAADAVPGGGEWDVMVASAARVAAGVAGVEAATVETRLREALADHHPEDVSAEFIAGEAVRVVESMKDDAGSADG